MTSLARKWQIILPNCKSPREDNFLNPWPFTFYTLVLFINISIRYRIDIRKWGGTSILSATFALYPLSGYFCHYLSLQPRNQVSIMIFSSLLSSLLPKFLENFWEKLSFFLSFSGWIDWWKKGGRGGNPVGERKWRFRKEGNVEIVR